MTKKKLMLVLCLAFLLPGCRSPQTPYRPRVVTAITLRTDSGLTCCYTENDSMDAILTYLRTLDLHLPPVSPPESTGELFTVTVHYFDGSCEEYRQLGTQLFCGPDGVWHPIDSVRAAQLPRLLHLLEPDSTAPPVILQ